MRVSSLGGARYFVTMIDDHSGWCEIYFLRHKSEVPDKFIEFIKMAETQKEVKVKSLQSDCGTEYCNTAMDNFLREKGIHR